MSLRRKLATLLAAAATFVGGASAATADADDPPDGRSTGSALSVAAPIDHETHHVEHAATLATALGVTEDRLGAVLKELRTERRATRVPGARPAIWSPEQREADRRAYAAALADKVGADAATAAAALDGVRPGSSPGT